MSCPVGGVLFRIGVLIHAYGFSVFVAHGLPSRHLYIAVSGFGLTRCTLLPSIIPLATLLESRNGRKQSEALAAEATGHVALHG